MHYSNSTFHVYRLSSRANATLIRVDTYASISLEEAIMSYQGDYLHDEREGTHVFFIDALSGDVLASRLVQATKRLVSA